MEIFNHELFMKSMNIHVGVIKAKNVVNAIVRERANCTDVHNT